MPRGPPPWDLAHALLLVHLTWLRIFGSGQHVPRVRIKREMNPRAPVWLQDYPRKIKAAERLVLWEVFSCGLWLGDLWVRLKPGLQLALGLGLVLGLGGWQTLSSSLNKAARVCPRKIESAERRVSQHGETFFLAHDWGALANAQHTPCIRARSLGVWDLGETKHKAPV